MQALKFLKLPRNTLKNIQRLLKMYFNSLLHTIIFPLNTIIRVTTRNPHISSKAKILKSNFRCKKQYKAFYSQPQNYFEQSYFFSIYCEVVYITLQGSKVNYVYMRAIR